MARYLPSSASGSGTTWGTTVRADTAAMALVEGAGEVVAACAANDARRGDAVDIRHAVPAGRMEFANLGLVMEVPPMPALAEQPCLPHRRFAVGAYTEPHAASPFAGTGDVPHDDARVGAGVLLFERPAGDPAAPRPAHDKLRDVPSSFTAKGPATPCGPNPSFVVKHPKKDVVYVCNEDVGGRVGAYTVCDSCFASLGPHVATVGDHACHVSVSPDGGWVAVCSYSGGAVTFVRVDTFAKTCGLTEETRVLRLPRDAAGPDVDRQGESGPHAHTCVFGAQLGERAWAMYVCDLGSDRVYVYRFEVDRHDRTCSWTPNARTPYLVCPPGSGPRSVAFLGTSRMAVSLEMHAAVLVADVLPEHDGALVPLPVPCVVPLLPRDWPPPELARFNAGRWASDVVATPDGKWVFALLRLRNTVVSLRHDAGAPASSALMPVSEAPTGAETPRQCVLEVVSDAIVLLYIAHHHGHAVTRVVCYLDEGRAGLMEDGVVVADAPLASCVCVL